MKKIENGCVGCTEVGLSCLGRDCPQRVIVRLFCDKCGYEFSTLYKFDDSDDELCEECALERLTKIDGTEDDDYEF